jgi:hypothetical protein
MAELFWLNDRQWAAIGRTGARLVVAAADPRVRRCNSRIEQRRAGQWLVRSGQAKPPGRVGPMDLYLATAGARRIVA